MTPEHAKAVLKAFRGYFRGETPPEPKDLTHGQEGAEGVIRHCIDSRLDEKHDLHLRKGEFFESSAAGAAVPPWKDGKGLEAQSVVDLGYPIMHIDNADTIVIEGHTYCGANKAMYNAMLKDADPDSSFEARWMMPIAPKGLQAAVKNADRRGADKDTVLRLVEQISVLQSMRNLHDYYFNDSSAKALINSGKLKIVGAIRDLGTNNDGSHSLIVFDPDKHAFRNIEEIYKEAGKPSLDDMRTGTMHHKGLEQPKSLIVKKGATTRTVAELDAKAIDKSIQLLIGKINTAGRHAAWRQ